MFGGGKFPEYRTFQEGDGHLADNVARTNSGSAQSDRTRPPGQTPNGEAPPPSLVSCAEHYFSRKNAVYHRAGPNAGVCACIEFEFLHRFEHFVASRSV